jgi:hypothetical protein
MKLNLMTICIPTDEALKSGFTVPDNMIGKLGIVFTKEEYDNHIETIIRDVVDIVADNADADVNILPDCEGNPTYEVYVLRGSITELLPQILEKYKS